MIMMSVLNIRKPTKSC